MEFLETILRTLGAARNDGAKVQMSGLFDMASRETLRVGFVEDINLRDFTTTLQDLGKRECLLITDRETFDLLKILKIEKL